jgi:flavin-dependent dehydrogenase
MSILQGWATETFQLSTDQSWRTITPLTRGAIAPAHDNLLFIGDAARVVEPFTGEGIFYALRSGELAAAAIARMVREENRQAVLREFAHECAQMYRGRLWINHIARAAVLSPRLVSALLQIPLVGRSVLRSLTAKTVS